MDKNTMAIVASNLTATTLKNNTGIIGEDYVIEIYRRIFGKLRAYAQADEKREAAKRVPITPEETSTNFSL